MSDISGLLCTCGHAYRDHRFYAKVDPALHSLCLVAGCPCTGFALRPTPEETPALHVTTKTYDPYLKQWVGMWVGMIKLITTKEGLFIFHREYDGGQIIRIRSHPSKYWCQDCAT